MRNTLTFLMLLLAAVATVAGAESHPFSIHDMVAMERIGDPQVSPDGRQIVFVLRTTDLEANRGRTDLWLVGTDGADLRLLTSHARSNPLCNLKKLYK